MYHATRMSPVIPERFLARMASLLGDEYASFLASFAAASSVGLRVNTLKVSVDAFRAIFPFELAPAPWCPAGFIVNEQTLPPTPPLPGEGREPPPSLPEKEVGGPGSPGKHPYHAAGLYYLQDPSAMAVAELLDPRPGERVLDLAAAPGGKATHIASLMQNDGLLVANEIHPKRAWELAGNLERWGARNAAVTNETPERLAKRFPGFFDRVLLDAPCSGEGMMRKGEVARREWAPELIRGCALRQVGILDHAARLVRPGGRLVYSTCTFNPEENEGALADFLAGHPDFALIEPPRYPGFSPGRPDWLAIGAGLVPALKNPSSTKMHEETQKEVLHDPSCAFVDAFSSAAAPHAAALSSLARAVRLWPHRAPGEGHFIAVLERAAEAPADPLVKPWRPARLPRPVEEAYRAFCAAALKTTDSQGHTKTHENVQKNLRDASCSSWMDSSSALALVGSYLYALPDSLPDLIGLRFLHPGWWLGTLKKDRFEPAHALALGLKPRDAQRVLALPADAPALTAYLRGETLTSPGEDGWTLVVVDGFPMGWGKRTGGRLKSHYPHGLRRV